MSTEKETLNGYYINFAFDVKQRQPGTIVAVANSKEEALEKFNSNMEGFENIEVFEVVDIDTVPSLKNQVTEQQEFETALEEFEAQLDDDSPVAIDEKKVH